MRYDRVVLAYHGCDAAVAARLLAGEPFRKSENDYDWLGAGVYFWEYGADRALQFARDQQRRGKVAEPAVVGALVQLGHCFELMDTAYTRDLASAFREYRSFVEQHGQMLPRNAGSTPDKKLRRLDCSVLNFYLASVEAHGVPFDTVRGGFQEGERAFPGSGIFRESHVQIAVRNSACIVGVFRPTVQGMAEDEDLEEDDETFYKTFYEYDQFGYPLDPETRERRALLREIWAKYRKMTREEAIAFLVKLGTHNPDGTLTEQYADNGEPSKYRPRD